MNRIVRVCLVLLEDDTWRVDVTKQFAPEHGGGTQVFLGGPVASIHRALDIAREMVTVSPAQRTDAEVL